MEHWDLIIVGAGAAGLTAGIYGARSGLKTLILEEKIPGGSTAEAPLIENYPGFPEGVSGIDLINRMVEHAERAGAQIHELEKVIKLNLKADKKNSENRQSCLHGVHCDPYFRLPLQSAWGVR